MKKYSRIIFGLISFVACILTVIYYFKIVLPSIDSTGVDYSLKEVVDTILFLPLPILLGWQIYSVSYIFNNKETLYSIVYVVKIFYISLLSIAVLGLFVMWGFSSFSVFIIGGEFLAFFALIIVGFIWIASFGGFTEPMGNV